MDELIYLRGFSLLLKTITSICNRQYLVTIIMIFSVCPLTMTTPYINMYEAVLAGYLWMYFVVVCYAHLLSVCV